MTDSLVYISKEYRITNIDSTLSNPWEQGGEVVMAAAWSSDICHHLSRESRKTCFCWSHPPLHRVELFIRMC